MNVDLLVTPDCPHSDGAEALLRSALDDLGLSQVPIRVSVVHTPQDAERRNFPGSPTLLIEGADPFTQPGLRPAFGCRVYPNATGLPDPRQLRRALKRAAAERGRRD